MSTNTNYIPNYFPQQPSYNTNLQQQLIQPGLQQNMSSNSISPINNQFIQRQGIDINDPNKKKYSLKNKIEELKLVSPEMQMFVFGIDIPNVGISNLSQEQQIHPTFGSPFAENPTIKIDSMNYDIPQCYNKPSHQLNEALVKKFPLETLFYIFYNVPEEQQQLIAVSELYLREWSYNSTQQSWMLIQKNIGNDTYKIKNFDTKEWQCTDIECQLNLEQDFITLQQFKDSVSTTSQNNN